MDILKYVISYGLLLFVVLAALYFSRGLDPRDILKPALRMNSHRRGRRRLRSELDKREADQAGVVLVS
jgi:Trm5-related predicted tRNA methylase